MSNYNDPQRNWKTPSRSSPQGGGTRSCLCKNNTYSRKCCDGTLMAQGIGPITANPIPPVPVVLGFLLQQDDSFLLQQDGGKIIIVAPFVPTLDFLVQQDGGFILQQDLSKINIQ